MLSGFLVKKKDKDNLYAKMNSIYNMPREVREAMGKNGRKRMEEKFDRNIVINAYKQRLSSIDGK